MTDADTIEQRSEIDNYSDLVFHGNDDDVEIEDEDEAMPELDWFLH